MTYQEARNYLSSRPEAEPCYPFDAETLVFKIRGKIFAILAEAEHIARVNLKCDPVQAEFLRDTFAAVTPGYHMNKRHWNTVILDGSIPQGEIERMMDLSYALVVKGLKKVDRQFLETRYSNEQLYRDITSE